MKKRAYTKLDTLSVEEKRARLLEQKRKYKRKKIISSQRKKVRPWNAFNHEKHLHSVLMWALADIIFFNKKHSDKDMTPLRAKNVMIDAVRWKDFQNPFPPSEPSKSTTICNIVKYINSGWNPTQDSEWIEFRNNFYKEEKEIFSEKYIYTDYLINKKEQINE